MGLHVVTWNAAAFDARHTGDLHKFFADFSDFDLFLLAEHSHKLLVPQHRRPPDHIKIVQALRHDDWNMEDGCVIYYNANRLEPIDDEAVYRRLEGGDRDKYEKNFAGRAVGQLFEETADNRRGNYILAISVHAGHYWMSKEARSNAQGTFGKMDRVDLERIKEDLDRIKGIQDQIADAHPDLPIGRVVIGGDFNQIGILGTELSCRSELYSPISDRFVARSSNGDNIAVRDSITTEKTTIHGGSVDRIFASGPDVEDGDAGSVGDTRGSDHHCVWIRDV